jgi:hypothetical protein
MSATILSAPVAERRDVPRRQPAMGTVCQFDPALEAVGHDVGLVWNISATGVSMLLTHSPEVGAVLAGRLETEEGHALPVLFRVVHVKELETGDYFAGAQFARPLTPAELRPFVA